MYNNVHVEPKKQKKLLQVKDQKQKGKGWKVGFCFEFYSFFILLICFWWPILVSII